MKTLTQTQKNAARIALGTAQNIETTPSFRNPLRRVQDLLAGFGRVMRLIRAYNDLDRLSNRTLRDLGQRYGELDRVLQGHRPRVDR